MSLDKATVAHIAALARIKLKEDELERMAGELSRILDWIEQLNEVAAENVPPLASVVDTKLPFRKDVVTDGNYAADIVANATDAAHGFFTVPKVIE
ncbi:MAG: Asp-tRNA(Asn)/Glu-tRNA(Gln) amidotransferase subunit GatC [Alphaproteobacteria bacterium]